MRPLTLLVVAEFVVFVVLVALYARRDAAAAALPEHGVVPTPAAAPAPAAAADPARGAAAEAPPPERRAAAPTVPDAVPGDPIGIVVSGTIRGPDGAPVPDASLSLSREGEYHSADSAGPGAYAVAGLSPGVWQVFCRAENFARFEGECTLDARAFQTFDVELAANWVVDVKILGADGASSWDTLRKVTHFGMPYVVAADAPLTGDLPATDNSRVLWFGIGEWRGIGDFGTEPKSPKLAEGGFCGELLLRHPPPAHAALLLRNTLLQTRPIAAGQHELTFSLTADELRARLGTVRLRLVDADSNAPLPKLHVNLGTAQGGGSGGLTGADGRAELTAVLPGLGCLEIYAPEHEMVFRHVQVPSGGVLELGDVALSSSVTLRGNVLGSDGKPGNGASVQWTELDSRTFPQPLADRRSASADDQGKFQIENCGRHRYVVHARLGRTAMGFATVDATHGAPPPVTITLAATTKVVLKNRAAAHEGYSVAVLANDRSPVAVALRPGLPLSLPPGDYTLEIHDLCTGRLVRTAPLHVGSEPLTVEVP